MHPLTPHEKDVLRCALNAYLSGLKLPDQLPYSAERALDRERYENTAKELLLRFRP